MKNLKQLTTEKQIAECCNENLCSWSDGIYMGLGRKNED